MKVFIVEDEIPAQINLKTALRHNFDDIEFVGKADSVTEAVKWLKNPKNEADIIFMDVQLSDGMCFEIFKQVDTKADVIITTAYDNYAIKAFKANCIDYLLKPIDHAELVAAVEKCRERRSRVPKTETYPVEESPLKSYKHYKQRFVIKLGDRMIIVAREDIAYFFSEEKLTYIMTNDGKKYIVDQSLDAIMPMVDGKIFFRLSRAYIVSIDSINSVSKHLGNRLKVSLKPDMNNSIYVSRIRVADFVKWLNGE